MAEVVLDANILVAQLDANDSLHSTAVDLVAGVERGELFADDAT